MKADAPAPLIGINRHARADADGADLNIAVVNPKPRGGPRDRGGG